MTFWTVWDKLNFPLTLLIAEFVICMRFPKRKYWIPLMILGCAPSLLLGYFWMSWMTGFNVWCRACQFLAVFIGTFAMMALTFKGDFWAYLFAGVMGYCAQHIAYQTHTILINAIKLANTEFSMPNWADMLLVIAFYALIYTGIYFLFTHRLPKGEIFKVNNKLQTILSSIVLIITVFISFFGVVWSGRDNTREVIIICLFSDMACLLAIFLEVSFLQLKKNEAEIMILRHMVHSAKQQLKESKESIDIINIKSHDLRHQIIGLKGRVDEEELQRIADAVNIYDNTFKTGNDALDVVLTEKGLLCKEKNVRLTCMVKGATLNGMKQSDIYSLFGNAIENAVESVENLDEDRRAISISEMDREGISVIRIENYFDGEITFEEGVPQTKKSKNYHGFGTKSMRMIVEKYGGQLTFSTHKDIFRVDILLPLKAQ